jgi:hypothetical protein
VRGVLLAACLALCGGCVSVPDATRWRGHDAEKHLRMKLDLRSASPPEPGWLVRTTRREAEGRLVSRYWFADLDVKDSDFGAVRASAPRDEIVGFMFSEEQGLRVCVRHALDHGPVICDEDEQMCFLREFSQCIDLKPEP